MPDDRPTLGASAPRAGMTARDPRGLVHAEAELLAALVEQRERYPASAVRERSRERLRRYQERHAG